MGKFDIDVGRFREQAILLKKGYPRSGTADLRNIFEKSIHVKHIAVYELENCRPDEDPRQVLERMKESDLDVLIVNDGKRNMGYVEKKSIDGTASSLSYRHFNEDELIGEEEPFISVLPILKKWQKVFVCTHRRNVVAIVTQSDLQKAPMRLFLFGLVTLLETQMLRIVTLSYSEEECKNTLNERRRELALDLQRERKKRNEDLGFFDCLQLSDKRDLILKRHNLAAQLEVPVNGDEFFKKIEDLRNKLAHSQDLVRGTSWPDIIDCAERIERLLVRCEEFAPVSIA